MNEPDYDPANDLQESHDEDDHSEGLLSDSF